MSQKNNFAYRVEERKELTGLASSNNKSVAGLCKLGVEKATGPSANYRPHQNS